jgi:hypothetical protein
MKFNKIFLYIFILLVILLFGLYYFVFNTPETKNLESKYPKGDFIELKMEVYKESIEQDEYTKKFNKTVLYSLIHPENIIHPETKYGLLPIFTIVDFKKGEITYLNLYTPENIKKLEEDPVLKQAGLSEACTTHTSIMITPEEDFYVIPISLTSDLVCNYIYYVNIKDETVKIITPKALGLENENKNFFFGSFLKKPDDPNTLFMALRIITDSGYKLGYYQSDLYLNNIKQIYETQSEKDIGDPHGLLYYKYKLFTTNLFRMKIKLVDKGLQFNSLIDFYNFVIKDTFDRENPSGNKQDAEAYFQQKYNVKTFKDFKNFCLKNNYTLEFLPGTIRAVDLQSKTEKMYYTNKSCTGHFGWDEQENVFYVSNHDADYLLGKMALISTAGIGKYKIEEDGELTFMGVFTDPKGYRFTSHKFFKYQNKPYVVTVGYPNRLFIIDGETMTPVCAQDIGDDLLSKTEDVNDLMTSEIEKNSRIVTMEASYDGSVILFFQGNYIHLYEFPSCKLVGKIEFKRDITLANGENVRNFLLCKGHSDSFAQI